jgi:hypothetical protein
MSVVVPELIASLNVPPFLGDAITEDDIEVAADIVAPSATAPWIKSRLPILPEANRPFNFSIVYTYFLPLVFEICKQINLSKYKT